MAHNIGKRDQQTGVKLAWHGLTNVVENITRENCGIVYGMKTQPLYIRRDDEWHEIEARQIVSQDDGLPVGRPVSDSYKMIANSEIWDAVGGAIEGTQHKVVSCGTVLNRSLGFVSVKVSDDFIAAGRATQSVLNVLWGHGGNKGVVARSGFTVVVCQNTYNRAMTERSDFKLSMRHTTNANVLDLGRAIEAHIGVQAEFRMAMNELHEMPATEETAKRIYAGLLAEETPNTAAGKTRISNVVDCMTELFRTGKGNKGETMADVFNGLTDYYSHGRNPANPWKQFVSSEFGSGANHKTQAMDVMINTYRLADVIQQGKAVLADLKN